MADALVLDLDSKFLERLDKADKALQKLIGNTDRLNSVLTSLSSGGLNKFSSSIDVLVKHINKLSVSNIGDMGLSKMNNEATKAVDAVNKMVSATNKIGERSSTDNVSKAMDSMLDRVKRLKAEIDQFNAWEGGKLLNTEDYKYIGGVADELNRVMAAYSALDEMQKRQKASSGAFQDQMAKLTGSDIQTQKSKHQLAQMGEFYKEQERLAVQADKEEEKRYQQTLKRLDERSKAERKALEEKEMAQRRIVQLDAQAIREQRTTYSGAMQYADSADSIQKQIQAIKYLKEARDKLTVSSAGGQKQYKQQIDDINQKINLLSTNVKTLTGDFQGLSNTTSALGKMLAGAFSLNAIKGYVSQLMRVRGEFELQQRSLQALLQSKDEANKLWQQTTQLALKSPYSVSQLIRSTKQLAAYRIESEKLYETNKMLSDISAGVGVEVDRLILAYGQVKAANYLRGTELRQFSEAGINILGELAKYFTTLEGRAVSVGDVFERVSKRMVSFADVDKVLRKQVEAGGVFYQMQEKQAETLKGSLSNLKDQFDLMLNDIGQKNDGLLKTAVSGVAFLLKNWESLINVVYAGAAAFAAHRLAVMTTNKSYMGMAYHLGIIQTLQVKQLSLVQLLSLGFRKLGKSIATASKAMVSFITTNPAIAAVGVLVALLAKAGMALYEHRQKIKEIEEEYANLRKKATEISVKFHIAYDKEDLKGVKTELAQLLSSAENDYGLRINVNTTNLDLDQAKAKFEEIYQIISEANTLAENFGKLGIQEDFLFGKSLQGGIEFGQALNKDLSQYQMSFNKTYDLIKDNIADVILKLREQKDTLSDVEKEAYKQLTTSKKAKESDEAYHARIIKAYEELKGKIDEVDAGSAKIDRNLRRLTRRYREAAREIGTLFDNLSIDDNLSNEEKETRIKVAIDKYAFENGYNDILESLYDLANKKWNINITPTLEVDKNITPEWVKRVRPAIEEINNELTKGYPELAKMQFFAVPTDSSDLQTYISTVKSQIKEVTQTFLDGQQVYDAMELKRFKAMKEYVEEIQQVLNIVDKNANNKAEKTLSRRISLIKEMRDKYLELNKVMAETDANNALIKDYAKTFSEVFEGTDLTLTKIQKVMQELSGDTTKKLIEPIRMYSEEFKNALKLREGKKGGVAALRLYDDSTGDIIRNALDWNNKVGTATIGFGHAVHTYAEAVAYLGKTISENEAEDILNRDINKTVRGLNKILELHEEIVLTQGQYDVLLDRAFQAGPKSVDWFLNMATDTEKALEHFAKLDTKLKKVGMSFEAVFGADFVQRFKDVEDVSERIAMVLETINLTTKASGSQIDKNIFAGMLKRSKDQADTFREAADETAGSYKKVAAIDFSNIEEVIDFLKKLRPAAKKEGKKAVEALEQEISRLEITRYFEISKEQQYKLSREIEDLFSGYQLSIELEKLNVPSDFAQSLFGLAETRTIEELRGAVIDAFKIPKDKKEELSKNLKDIDWKLFDDILSKDEQAALKAYLAKITDLETKAQQERLKKYLNYSRNAIGERAKIKLEELRQLKEIEDTFDKASTREGLSDADKARIEEQRKLAIEGVKKESNDKMRKIEWEDFKSSDMFVNLFQDLDNASDKLLTHAIGKIKEFKKEWTDMPVESAKEMILKLNELELALMDTGRPARDNKALKDFLKEEMAARKIKENATAGSKSNKALAEAVYTENAVLEEDIALSQKRIAVLKVINNLTAENKQQELEKQGITQEYLQSLDLSEKVINQTVKKNNDLINADKKRIQDQSKLLATNNKILNAQKAQKANLEKQADAIDKAQKMANDLYSAFSELSDVFGGGDGPAAIFADMGMSMLDTVLSTIQLHLQLKAAQVAAKGLGAAMNTAMGVVGWIVMAVQLLATVLKAAFTVHDNALEGKIEGLATKVETLEKEFENLEKKMDEAFSTEQIEEYSQAMRDNINARIKDLDEMHRLESQKKKSDEEELKRLREEQQQLEQDLVDMWAETNSKVTAGILDNALDAAEGFVDAWLEAFKETGDGLSGLEENFTDMLTSILKRQAALQIVGKFTDQYSKWLNEYVNAEKGDTELTPEEAKEWATRIKETMPELSALLGAFFEGTQGLLETGGGMSELSKGIQGVTETTAQVIEAYLNSVRFYAADSNSKLSTLISLMGGADNTGVNPMVEQLRIIATNTSAIGALLADATYGGRNGMGFRVFLQE